MAWVWHFGGKHSNTLIDLLEMVKDSMKPMLWPGVPTNVLLVSCCQAVGTVLYPLLTR